MNNGMKVILLVVLLLYVASPVDLAPGPVDDLIMILIYALINRSKERVLEAGNSEKAITDRSLQ